MDGILIMALSYNKLWKRLIDLNMTKTQLCQSAGLCTVILARMSKANPRAQMFLREIVRL